MAALVSAVFWMASLSLATGTTQNVALKKPAWVSKPFQAESLPATNAVDGVLNTADYTSTMHTKLDEPTAWWKVDLQRNVQSAQIQIYFRTDFKYRRNGVQLYTSGMNSSDPKTGDLCHTVRGRADGTDILDVLNVICPGTWRYLTVFTETDNDGGGAILDFAEVQVWTCDPGYYGFNCVRRCAARHCKMGSTCDAIQGRCVDGCAAGYHGTDCRQGCPPGRYGAKCVRHCTSRHCKTRSSTCDTINGTCFLGCGDGWTGMDCYEECPVGMFGTNCNSICGHCADNITCHHVTGTCPGGCQAGWTLPLCQTELQTLRDSVFTPTTAGVIGLAAGICFMLILGVGLCVVLVRQGRLHWRSSSKEDPVNLGDTQKPKDKGTRQPSDNCSSIAKQGDGDNIHTSDYAALDAETDANNEYVDINIKA